MSKSLRLILVGIFFIILFIKPLFFGGFYSSALYYYGTFIVLLPLVLIRIIWDEKFEQRFRNRWKKARERSYWITVLLEAIRSLIIMIILISVVQFAVYSRTPFVVIKELSNNNALGWIIFLMIGINAIIGIVSWHENEKRFLK